MPSQVSVAKREIRGKFEEQYRAASIKTGATINCEEGAQTREVRANEAFELLRKRVHQPADTDGNDQEREEGPQRVLKPLASGALGKKCERDRDDEGKKH